MSHNRSLMWTRRLLFSILLVAEVQGFSPVQPWAVSRSSVSLPGFLRPITGTYRSPIQSKPILTTLHDAPNPPSRLVDRKSVATRSSGVTGKALSLTSKIVLSTAAAALLAPAAGHALELSAVAAAGPAWLSSLSQTGFYQAFSLVFLSEIGDKTFFIAGLLSAKTSRIISFVGSMGALAAMTLVSVLIGQIFHAVPEGFGSGFPLDDVAACLAFLFFGIKTLKEAFDMEPGESTMDEEFADAQEAVEGSESVKQVTPWGQLASIFALVFAAEFGDRSFLSTIALSAAQNPVAVAGGAIAAHSLATGIAVSGGAVLAKYLSERVLGFIGGTLFIVFAITTGLGIF